MQRRIYCTCNVFAIPQYYWDLYERTTWILPMVFNFCLNPFTVLVNFPSPLLRLPSARIFIEKENVISSALCTSPHVSFRDGQNQWTRVHYSIMTHSLDLAQSGYFLFPNLKQWFGGQRFASNEPETAAVDHRWAKFNELKGDYIEKINIVFENYCSSVIRSGTYGTALVVIQNKLFVITVNTKSNIL